MGGRGFALLLVLLLGTGASSPAVVSPTSDDGGVDVVPDYLVDPGGELTLEQAMAGTFTRAASSSPSFGYTSDTYWLRFQIENRDDARKDLFIELGYPLLDHVELYLPGPDGTRRVVTGDRLPFAERPVDYSTFLVPVAIAPRSTQTVVLRIASSSSIQAPITVWTPRGLAEHVDNRSIALGLYYGVMLVMVFYNLFIFITIRERSYLYYVLFAASFLLVQMAMNGVAYQHLWPRWPWWANAAIPFLVLNVSLWGVVFTRVFIDTARHAPRIHPLLVAFPVLTGALLVPAVLLPYAVAIKIAIGLAVVGSAGVLAVGVLGWRRGYRPARYFVIAWGAFVLGTILYSLKSLGVLPSNAFTNNLQQIGSAMEVVLLSFALADRINILKQEKNAATAEALEVRARQADLLQEEVTEKTRDLRTAVARLQQMDEQKTRFYENLTHELRTPLTLIIGPLEAALSGRFGEMPPQIMFHNVVMLRNARRLLRLINQLLDLAKLEERQMDLKVAPVELVGFCRTLADAFEPMAERKQIRFEFSATAPSYVAAVDREKLEKVIFNLLSNAFKFTPVGGRITLTVGAHGKESVAFCVEDTGAGIAAEALGHIFERFHQVDSSTTREHEGTGIGLALVKEYVELHGGTVSVDSTPGQGTRFEVRLPCPELAEEAPAALPRRDSMIELAALEVPSPSAAIEPARPPGAPGETVLVVEDNPDMRHYIRGILADDFHVVEAVNGEEGLALARERRPDLIVSDVMMPRMDGYELLASLRRNPATQNIPVVLVTARAQDEEKVMSLESGADDYLSKPFNPKELMARVHNLLRLRKQEREIEALNRHLTEKVLKRYLPGELVDQIVSGEVRLEQEPKTVEATILFGDLVGFTSAATKLDAPQLSTVLNEYFSRMSEEVFAHGGTVDKFLGDGIMVMFGAPLAMPPAEQVDRAARCALSMQRAMTELGASWVARGLPALPMRIGLHHGPVVVGNFGSDRRLDFTAIGPNVNLSERIQSVAPPGAVLVSQAVRTLLNGTASAEPAGSFALKGIAGEVACWKLVARP